MTLLNPNEVFDAFWHTALQDAQFYENEYACMERRTPDCIEGDPAATYGPKYHATVTEICAMAEPLLATLNLNEFPLRKGEDSLSDCFGYGLYMTAVGHGVGFWDGDWSDIGDALTELAAKMPSGSLVEHIDGGLFFI